MPSSRWEESLHDSCEPEGHRLGDIQSWKCRHADVYLIDNVSLLRDAFCGAESVECRRVDTGVGTGKTVAA